MIFTSLASDEQHISVIMAVREGVINIDIPHSYYETGSGFTWRKTPGCVFEPDMIAISDLDRDPRRIALFGEATQFLSGFQSDGHEARSLPSDGTYGAIVLAADTLDKEAIAPRPEATTKSQKDQPSGPN